MAIDYGLYHFLHSLSGQSPMFDYGTMFCAVYLPMLLAIGAVVYVLCAKRAMTEKLVPLISAAISIAIARIVFTGILRLLAGRARPFTIEGATSLFKATGSSFPSAHATILFAAGPFIYAYDQRAGILFYILATLVCIARVIAGVHYPSDIIAGMVVGTLAGALVQRHIAPRIRKAFAR